MGRPCIGCNHPQRTAIESAILSGRPVSRTARDYHLKRDALDRHMRLHCKRDVQTAIAERNDKHANGLLERIQESRADLQRILKAAEGTRELAVAVNAIQGGLRALELEGRVTGELSSGGTSINIALGVRVDVAQTRLQAYDAARTLPSDAVIERAAEVLRAACESGDARAGELVRGLQATAPREGGRVSEAEVIE